MRESVEEGVSFKFNDCTNCPELLFVIVTQIVKNCG